ncbi:MAG TPA: carboxypeptidase-like regulatory domain-containing protein [Polyangia bacterium]|nr:carboxypeptidase-like regulatory domain-containing protein [Polyangia bacterium]
MRRRHPFERVSRLALGAVAMAALAGCDMRPLSNDQLFPNRDAGVSDARQKDARMEAAMDGASHPDARADAAADRGPPDAGRGDVAPPPCTVAACAADQFCDDLTGRCAPRTGTGMLSGVVTDRCSGRPLSAKIGIAGQHMCSYEGKGSYFFTNLPLGTLRLAVALDGYDLVSMSVVIAPGGSVADVAMTRAAPLTCADPGPVAPACTCVEPTCS